MRLSFEPIYHSWLRLPLPPFDPEQHLYIIYALIEYRSYVQFPAVQRWVHSLNVVAQVGPTLTQGEVGLLDYGKNLNHDYLT